jgi:hypothetical protein
MLQILVSQVDGTTNMSRHTQPLWESSTDKFNSIGTRLQTWNPQTSFQDWPGKSSLQSGSSSPGAVSRFLTVLTHHRKVAIVEQREATGQRVAGSCRPSETCWFIALRSQVWAKQTDNGSSMGPVGCPFPQLGFLPNTSDSILPGS